VLAPPMDGYALAEDVAIADSYGTRAAGIAKVLRFVADYGAGMENIVFANFGAAEDRDVAYEACARANSDAAFQHAEGTDFDVRAEFDLAPNDCAGMDPRITARRPFRTAITTGAFQCSIFFLGISSGCSRSSTLAPGTR
jgi:hypothetical protein